MASNDKSGAIENYIDDIASLDDLGREHIKGKDVLVRVSFDAFDSRGHIKDSLRIEAAEPTIKFLRKNGARRIILMTYAGRPEKNPKDAKLGDNSVFSGLLYDKRYSVRPAADFLHGLMKERVHFISALDDSGKFLGNAADYVEHAKKYMDNNVGYGEIILLDNLRFWEGENSGDKEFARLIGSLGSVYVQDAFAQAHRANNATIGEITSHVDTKVMGLQFKKEVHHLKNISDRLVKKDRGTFVFIVGGKKIETKPGIVSKIDVVNKLMDSMHGEDKIFIGGAMAFPFLVAERFMDRVKSGDIKSISEEEISSIAGSSYVDYSQIHSQVALAGQMLLKACERGLTIKLPRDHGVIRNEKTECVECLSNGMSAGDIGSSTISDWCKDLNGADTIVLAGPVGCFENESFSRGSKELSRAIGSAVRRGAMSIAAGGDTVAMVRQFGHHRNYSLLSIGGGATLEFLLYSGFPSMKMLDKKEKFR